MSNPERPDSKEARKAYFRDNFTHEELIDQAVFIEGLAKAALHRVRNEMEMERDLYHDELTGVLNRRGLRQAYVERRQKRTRKTELDNPDLVMLIDLDKFKAINDEHGHKAGDDTLRSMAELFRTSLRDQDVIGRPGGDEFVAFLHNTDLDQGVIVAEKMRLFVKRFGEMTVNVLIPTLSIGLAEIDYEHGSFDDMFVDADQAMYAAKRAGRDQVSVLRP